jgi:MFS transporter, putative metabolite:H+ symporter
VSEHAAEQSDLVPEARTPKYLRKLRFTLSVATFFNGYDGFVLALVLPLILGSLGGSESQAGIIRGVVGIGAVFGFLMAAQADRIGRRRLLLITVIGYTAATLATAAAPSLLWLAAAQFVSQIFLAGEWAVAITIIVEEFPHHQRGRALGAVTAMDTLGGITVGLLAFVGLQNTALSWRAFYLVGIIPLIVIAFARRSLKETRRYEKVQHADEDKHHLDMAKLTEPWRPEYRRNLVSVGIMHFFRYAATSAAVFWFPFYAQQEVGLSLSTVGLYIGLAGIVGALGYIVGGRSMDRWGRRPTFIVYMAGAVVFGVWLFQIRSAALMLPVLCLSIFFGLGSAAVTSAFSTEFFPTYMRSRAAAWCRNAFEIPGGIFGPLVVGLLGDHQTGPVGSIGDAMSLLFIATILPVAFVAIRYIGETRNLDLAAFDEATL